MLLLLSPWCFFSNFSFSFFLGGGGEEGACKRVFYYRAEVVGRRIGVVSFVWCERVNILLTSSEQTDPA